MADKKCLGNFPVADAPGYEGMLQCMRCGFCLPTCPTYVLSGRERSSPRGRIALAKAVADDQLEFTTALKEEAYFCLDCRACSTSCPSGVHAGQVMEACRNQAQAAYPLTGAVRKFREFVLQRMLPSPDLLETSMLPARLYQKLGIQWLVRHSHILRLGPDWIAKAEGMMPELHPPLRPQLPDVMPSVGPRRGRVAFFLGCIMTLMYPEVSRQTVKVLTHQGFDVITPKDQKCCGAPHLNEGDRETTRRLALYNLELFMALDVDAIVTDCAGCGAALKEYEELLEESGDHDMLHAFRSKVKDISEFLAEQGLRTENLKPLNKQVTYHEPCHLCHAQNISRQPRELIKAIPGIEFCELNEASWCCGSAATFSLKYTSESQLILDRKLENIRATGAELLVTANPGCHLQLAWGLKQANMPQQVVHITELLGMATV
ncbi:MAG: (Fe-S)-binding protein [Deltaproteobacteria bacterium]|nr:(Fe-S)-binding protein [Deltaproteobacteria bacterium]MBW2519309.1 (Fe-S)-binding protein [Deltaproteobacteria bacterium]